MENGYRNPGIVVAAVVLAYILSVGPVAGLMRKGIIPARFGPFIEAVYSPLEYTYDHMPAAKTAFDWYIGLWTPR